MVLKWDEASGDPIILKDVDIVIENGKIVNIGRDVKGSFDEVLDCSNCIVIPGIVNAHTHSPMVMLRGYCDDYELHEWLSRVWEVEKPDPIFHTHIGQGRPVFSG